MNNTEKKAKQTSRSTSGSSELERIIEAALFATDETLSVRQLQAMFPVEAVPSVDDLKVALDSLSEFYQNRSIELRKLGKGWRFHTRDIYSDWLAKLFREKPPRYSRALMETLSIIAYRQPVTRGEIEEIRGVAVRSEMLRTLAERGWIVSVGHRDVPGRPELLGTTDAFLQYFNLASLNELPELPDRRDMHDVAKDSDVEMPTLEMFDSEALGDADVAKIDDRQEADAGNDADQLAQVIELPGSNDANVAGSSEQPDQPDSDG